MPQRIRCKFVVEKVTRFQHNSEATLRAVSDKSTPENEAFTKYTPGGSLVVMIDNPIAVAMLEPGKAFYLDLTPVE